jgi:hypothetical protein
MELPTIAPKLFTVLLLSCIFVRTKLFGYE